MKKTLDITALIVNDVIRQHPGTMEVFKRHGIDACCGGASLVSVAAIRGGADVAALTAELHNVIAKSE